MADIQKKKKEILREREQKVLEHMEVVDSNLKANRCFLGVGGVGVEWQ